MRRPVAWAAWAILGGGCSGSVNVLPAHRAAAVEIWRDRCSNCHGDQGLGDGPGALILPVQPRVLADPRWQTRVSDEHIARVIVEGGASIGLDRAMAANADLRRQPEVVAALVELVRSL